MNEKTKTWLAAWVLACLFFAAAWPGLGHAASEPGAGAPKLQRGSAEESAEFEKHQLPFEKKAKKSPVTASAAALPQPPAGSEISQKLSPSDRPAVSFLKKKPAAQPPAAAPQLAPPEPARGTTLEYELKGDAELTITIIAADGAALRQFTISPGEEGGRKGKNRVLWDGRDDTGAAATAGEPVASLAIRYSEPGLGLPEAETQLLPLDGKKK